MLSKSIDGLTSIRFFAAFFVFFSHLEARWPLSGPHFITNIISQGPVAMSLFFILSGFILTYNYKNMQPHREYSQFIMRRFARIYPVYILAACLTLYWLGVPLHGDFQALAKIVFLMFTNIFIIQAWFPASFAYWNDGLSWSLSVEAFCYLLFPAILYYFLKLTDKARKNILIICYLCTILPSISFVLLDPKPIFPTIYALPIFRLPEFIMGIICCLIFFDTKTCKSIQFKFMLTVLFLLGYLALFGNSFPVIYIIHNFIVIPCFCLIIYYIAHADSQFPFNLLKNKYLKFLGESSYSFYLMQLLPLKWGVTLVAHYHFFAKHHWFLAITLFVINLLLATACYKLIEKPMRKYLLNYSSDKKMGLNEVT